MRLVLYGTSADKSEIARAISAIPEFSYRKITIEAHSDYDSFIAGLGGNPPDGIVVAENGANGMEGVIVAKSLHKNTPILWFSDDGGFGAQSYRLGCAFFHKKPISPDVMSAAIAKCV